MKIIAFFVFLLAVCWSHFSIGQESKSPVIFIVHGTYDGSASWPTIPTDGDDISFATEVKRGFGSECEVIPFLWRTDASHETRVNAAKDLAKDLDAAKNDGRRIFIIGHSHGGNVALESLKYSNRFVDMLFCLSTPHLYLKASKDGSEVSIPIYCSPKSRSQVGAIVTFSVIGDPVVRFFAGIRKGIDDETAVRWTNDWRALSGHPRLIDDGGPIQDLLEDWFSLSISRNLSVHENLNVGNYNFTFPSESSPTERHSVTHSGRIGYIVGNCIHDGISTDVQAYLQSLVIKEDVGNGEPESRNIYGTWWNENQLSFEHSGWVLSSISADCKSSKKSDGSQWDSLNDSYPDMFFRVRHEKSLEDFWGIAITDSESVTNYPNFHVPIASKPIIELYDLDVLTWETMGQFEVHDLKTQPTTESDQPNVIFKAEWKKAHY